MAMKLPFLPSVRPMRKRRAGKQNFTHSLSSFKTNNSFNSTIMASLQKEQTNREKYVFYHVYCSVSQIHINPEKNMKKL